jgi:uncharacterized protein
LPEDEREELIKQMTLEPETPRTITNPGKLRDELEIADNVRLSTQPLEQPSSDEHLLNMFEAMDAGSILMFASDYPHWDFDSPTHAFPKMPKELRERIFSENARSFYGLG